MKTYHEYEPADIDFDAKDPVVSFLLGQILIIGISGFKPQAGDPPDDPTWVMKRQIATFLNGAQRSGIVIAKAETVPEVYR